MIPWIAIVAALATAPQDVPDTVEAGGVRIEVAVRSHLYTWTVANVDAPPIVRFEVEQYGAYEQTVPNGWVYEFDGPRWITWTDDPRYAIGPGQSRDFRARGRSTGAILGTVPAQVGLMGEDQPVTFAAVWGPRPKRPSMVVLVALGIAAIAAAHTVIVARRRQPRPRASESDP